MNQSESLSAKRNSEEERQGVMKSIQKRKLEIELPENAYNLLAEIFRHGIDLFVSAADQVAIHQAVYHLPHMLFDGMVSYKGYLCKKYNYVPDAWRKEMEVSA